MLHIPAAHYIVIKITDVWFHTGHEQLASGWKFVRLLYYGSFPEHQEMPLPVVSHTTTKGCLCSSVTSALQSILVSFGSLFWFCNLQLHCFVSLKQISSTLFLAAADSCFQQISFLLPAQQQTTGEHSETWAAKKLDIFLRREERFGKRRINNEIIFVRWTETQL